MLPFESLYDNNVLYVSLGLLAWAAILIAFSFLPKEQIILLFWTASFWEDQIMRSTIFDKFRTKSHFFHDFCQCVVYCMSVYLHALDNFKRTIQDDMEF